MAVRNEMKGSSVQGINRTRVRAAGPAKRRGQRKKKITAMAPAMFFAGTPEYAKGVVGKWGKTICFEDHPYFMV